MVDRRARDWLARGIEDFLAGRTTYSELQRLLERTPCPEVDTAIAGVVNHLWRPLKPLLVERPWFLILRLLGRGEPEAPSSLGDLDAKTQTAIQRWRVFLRSNREYVWPTYRLEYPGGLALWGLFLCLASALWLIGAELSRRLSLDWRRFWMPRIGLFAYLAVILGWLLWERRHWRRHEKATREIGDRSALPFLSQAEYAEEVARQGGEAEPPEDTPGGHT